MKVSVRNRALQLYMTMAYQKRRAFSVNRSISNIKQFYQQGSFTGDSMLTANIFSRSLAFLD